MTNIEFSKSDDLLNFLFDTTPHHSKLSSQHALLSTHNSALLMSSANKNLSHYNKSNLPDVTMRNFGIVVAEWNAEITEALFNGCFETLIAAGVQPNHIKRIDVPGSFELTSGARLFAVDHNIDAVICIGCVIQGETRHFDFICNAVANGITQLCIQYNKPFIFGVLTPDNQQQAIDKGEGKHGNKGVEAAATAIKMLTHY